MAGAVPLAPPMVAAARPAAGSLYEALRVGRAATQVEIRTAYRSMAKRLHPDVASCGHGGPEAFLEIRRAYETLSDPAARARYDCSLGVFRGGGAGGVMRVRRWETDQCW
ncbi:hypothetical protein CFC21_108631 [Triticum aestivum]|uniref:J domain-containing protein n=3 Tax=Triticinae TaxID=1648030 RepID=A0A9R1MJ35_WHEAT|nr:hypothetical protein CFC21_108630 [Triticum aestivum]KAF7108095.1 hypothetical protein CFC21_108631 [Triticum aestivum]